MDTSSELRWPCRKLKKLLKLCRKMQILEDYLIDIISIIIIK